MPGTSIQVLRDLWLVRFGDQPINWDSLGLPASDWWEIAVGLYEEGWLEYSSPDGGCYYRLRKTKLKE